jgi:hypothetical protein
VALREDKTAALDKFLGVHIHTAIYIIFDGLFLSYMPLYHDKKYNPYDIGYADKKRPQQYIIGHRAAYLDTPHSPTGTGLWYADASRNVA